MTAALLFAGWTAIALGVGLVIGRAIRIADDNLADTALDDDDALYVPRTWVA